MSAACVVTTIHPPSEPVKQWEILFGDHLIVIGDRKTPADWRCGSARYLPIETQLKLPLESLKFLPENHYARKNIGYLQAMLLESSAIFETDDDNRPSARWAIRTLRHEQVYRIKKPGWCNIYTHLIGQGLWPRGLPLNHIRKAQPTTEMLLETLDAPIQQGLADGEPDVDAIWRLTSNRRIQITCTTSSMALGENVWCPFNSQATWWFPEAYELMYLPIHATFRMTDIWRSFVAQRCLWAMGKSVVFHSPAEVVQERNEHALLRDFEEEIPGYLHNEKIAAVLENLLLKNGQENVADNMRACYNSMVELGVLPKEELASLDAWLADVKMWRRT